MKILECNILVFFVSMLIFQSCVNECENSVRKVANGLLIKGIVTKKYKDSKDRYTPRVIIDDSMTSFIDVTIYDQIVVGDSIDKELNTLKYRIVRSDSVFELYPVCDGWLQIMDDTVMSLR